MDAIRRSALTAIGAATLIWNVFTSHTAGMSELDAKKARNPAKGVRCAASFETLYDPGTKVLRCRRITTSWVVTSCNDRNFASYIARRGRDVCGATQLPGIGAPPGPATQRSITCATRDYVVVVDRTGERDRCEREEEHWQLPVPVG